MKPEFLKAFAVSSEWRWDDGAASRLPQFLVLGSSGDAKRKPEISRTEARTALEATNDAGRTAALWQLHGMIQKSEDWRTLGTPFLANIWPRAIRYQTPAAAHVWANIAANADDAFPEVVQAVRNLLQPIDELDSAIFDLTHKEEGKRCLAERFPAEAVLLIDKLTSESRTYMPYNMREFLRLCAEQSPELSQNLSWRRLSDLISTT